MRKSKSSLAESSEIEQTEIYVLIATILITSMAFISQSSLNIAAPKIQNALDATGAELLWIMIVYSIFLAALLLVGGSLGDHFGRRRIFIIGTGIFTIASIACGFALNPEMLIVARAIQGIGGALMVPGSLAIISATFSPEKRGKAIGTWSAFTTLATVLGPMLGGLLAQSGLWRGVFFINIPFAVIALFLLFTKIPESYDESLSRTWQSLDYPGAILITIGLASLTYGFLAGSEKGFDTFLIILALVGGVAALILFVLVEWKSPNPMVPLSLFQSRTFSGTNAMTLFLYGALTGSLTFLPLNLIQIQGYTELETALAMLPMSIFLMGLSPWAGGLVDKYGPRLPLTIGPVIAGLGFFLFVFPGITESGLKSYWTTYFPAMAVLGIGMGITVAPLTTTVMSSVSTQKAGTASGINNAVSRIAGVLALAIMGAIALVSFSGSLTSRLDEGHYDLSPDIRAELDNEAVNLGEAEVPGNIETIAAQAIEKDIRWAFVDMFRLLMAIGAGMAWLSAGLAGLMVENRLTAVA